MCVCMLRFHLIAPFGKDKIRQFTNNASQMKKLAAHYFEDLLQVCIILFFIGPTVRDDLSTDRTQEW